MLALDDESAREARFRASATPDLQIDVRNTAMSFMEQFDRVRGTVALLALDHDLALDDPQDGLDVLRAVIERSPRPLPVVVHTSNTDRGQIMMGELELAGWPARRVLPFGDRWVESDWLHAVRELLADDPSTL